MLFAPTAIADEIRAAPRARDGAYAVALLGCLWSAFSLWLHLGGHAPSFVLLPIPKERYYLAQAVFVVPLTLALWWLMSTIAAALAGARDQRRRAATFAALGYAYAAPLIFGFLLVDVVIFQAAGFAALGRYIRFYAPIAPLWALIAGTIAVRRALEIGTGRAFAACAAAMLVQALVGAPFLR
jgi:hypothetical protein